MPKLYFWRTKSGVEVDFILYGPEAIYAIEVKNSSSVRPRDLSSLRSFKEDYPEAQAILLYRGKEKIKEGEVICLPCGDFLQQLIPGKSLYF